ncbi:MAG: hypothetical protein WD672_11565 [Woeseia sp.]
MKYAIAHPARRAFDASLWRLLPLLLILCAARGWCQAEDATSIHWAYSTYFGTGWYQIGDDRDAFAIRYAPRKTVREAALHDDGPRVVGLEYRLPVTAGLDQFPLDDIAGTVDLGNLANLSITPGIYAEIPVTGRWSLRPFGAIGWGTVLNGSESAFTYWAGIKSRLIMREGSPEIALLNSAAFVGYSPSNGPSSGFWPVMTALELKHPVAELEKSGDVLELNWHAAYTYFQNDLDVLQQDATSDPVSDQWEVGIAVSRRDTTVGFWRFQFDRVGIAWRVSSDGDLKGVGLVFGSLFDQ